MDEVLRFVVVRPPQSSEPDGDGRIVLRDPGDPSAVSAVDELRGGGESNREPPDLGDLANRLRAVALAIAEAVEDDGEAGELVARIRDLLGDAPNQPMWAEASAALDDAIVDGKFLRGANRERLGTHALLRRAMFAGELAVANGAATIELLARRASARFLIPPPSPEDPPGRSGSDEFEARKK